jgi:hypothetical protein
VASGGNEIARFASDEVATEEITHSGTCDYGNGGGKEIALRKELDG